MKVLALDTAGSSVVVAACDGASGELIAGATSEARAQSSLLVIDDVLCTAGWSRTDIDAIVVGTGPGGFTGVRVGVTTARGLAEALRVPLHPVSSLAALAESADHARDARSVWSVLDARRGEHFAQRFERDDAGAWQAVSVAATIANDTVAQLDGDVVTLSSATPHGLARATHASLRAAAASAGDPLTVTPEYVRGPDAQPPRPRLRIDEMLPSDLPAVLGIEQRSFPTPWSEAMYAEEIARAARGGAVCLVARDLVGGARVVAAVLAAWMGDSWHVMNVLVDPPARRRGIASQLLDQLLERTERHALGIGDGWTLEVREGNDAAIALYESRGFVNHGRRPGYYSDTNEAAVIMWRAAAVTDPIATS